MAIRTVSPFDPDNEVKPVIAFDDAPTSVGDGQKSRRSLKVDSPARLFGFSDPDEIKKNVRAKILGEEKTYDVHDLYWETGCSQFIAKHYIFENVTLAVISLNAVYIGVDTDWNKDQPLSATSSRDLLDSPMFFFAMEQAFCGYFTLEWIIRFCAFARKCNCLFDAWFVFDSIMVILMVGETWVIIIVMEAMGLQGSSPLGNTGILRLFRLLRLARLARMLRSLPELMILIKGMVTATTSVMYVMGMQVGVTYIFAVAFVQLTTDTPAGNDFFANVPIGMHSLFIHATFLDDLAAFCEPLHVAGLEHVLALVFVFICIASLTLMNMLVGVLCEVVSAVAETEKEEFLCERMVGTMRGVLEALGWEDGQNITYKEFTGILQEPEAQLCFQEIEVDPLVCLDFADLFFFADGQPTELSFEELCDILLNLRESNSAKVKDLYNLWNQLKSYRSKDQEAIARKLETASVKLEMKMEEKQDRIENKLSHLLTEMRTIPMQAGSPDFEAPLSPGSIAPNGTGRRVTPAVYRRLPKRDNHWGGHR